MNDDPGLAALTHWDFIEALGDGVYGVDRAGICTFINSAGLAMLGYGSASELLGRNMHEAIHHTRPDGTAFPQAECPLLHTAVSGHPVRLENEMLWRRDGTPFFAEYSSFPVTSGGTGAGPGGGLITGTVITFTDTSVRQGAQQRLTVQYAVSQILAGTPDPAAPPDHLLGRLLEAVGTGLAWDLGVFWLRQVGADGRDALVWQAEWRSRVASEAALGIEALPGTGPGRRLDLGVGLPGHVWVMGKPVHLADLSDAMPGPRQAEAARRGLHSAFGFPVIDGGTVLGVVEFYAIRRIAVDESLLESVATLGHQIGQALERRHAAGALGESERLKAAILASSPDCVITVDGAGRILEFNRTAETVFGHVQAEVLGSDMFGLVFPPETRGAMRAAFQALREGGDAGGMRVEVEAAHADGSLFPAEYAMTRTAEAPVPLFTGYLRDMTALRAEQAQKRESDARFRIIANAIPQLAWMTDAEGSITWYNQRWYDYTGTTFEEMRGWGWRSVHHPDHIERVERRLKESFRAGDAWEDTFPLRAADGSFSWFLSRALPIREEPDARHPTGRITGWFGSNTDVTEMRAVTDALEVARDEAEGANRAKSTFIANMSHELRTPLSAIIGYAEMLTEEIEDGVPPTDLSGDVAKIENNARHLLGLINDVLDLSKVESGKMEAFAESFDVAEMVEAVAATVGALMERKSNTLALALSPGLGSMHSDVTRIRQMLLNLLSNAAKFTERGLVTLSVERDAGGGTGAEAGWLRFAVTDSGIGMTEEQLGRLFQRFQQADASTTRQFGGTGLGLALTRAFAEMLGGRVAVASTPGGGSTFALHLPPGLPEPAPAVEAAPAPDLPGPGRDLVLVVDDDLTQRELTTRFLEREGYAALTAADGPTGLALARRMRPKAILLDVTMPGMDGWSVLGALKADPELAAVPVVMVTFANERALASSLGAADYVLKPVNWDRLRAVLEEVRGRSGEVLVVDDDADTRLRLRHALERSGWRVAEAADGREALERIGMAEPSIILLDLTMPVMDGFDFLHALRTRPGGGAIPVIVLSALDLTEAERSRLAGADQVLRKGSISLREIAQRLSRLGIRRPSADQEVEQGAGQGDATG